jgi:7,8-dihydroneopterin aldolase/epimerase/oxygenase
MEHETRVGQRFAIDLELKADLSLAASSDHLADTVSYTSIVETATRAFTTRSFKLVEAAAGVVAQTILARFARIEEVRVVVHKPHAPISATFDDVGVALTRRRGQ